MRPVVFVASMATAAAAVQPESIKPVTPGTCDVSPLAEPLHLEPISLEIDSDFRRLYEARDSRGLFGQCGEPIYIRMSGAIKALFPRSSYIEAPGGELPTVPNNTIWHIGELPREMLMAPQETEPWPLKVDRSASRSATGANRTLRHTTPRHDPVTGTPTGSIWTAPSYRERRLCALLDRAMRQ
jgi:hypothetical protein